MKTISEEKIIAKQFWELYIKMSKPSGTQPKLARDEKPAGKTDKVKSACPFMTTFNWSKA